MRTFPLSKALAIALLSAPTLVSLARADDRKADQILTEINAVKLPKFDSDKQKESGYIQQYLAEQRKAMGKRAVLIRELYKVDPENVELATLLPARWQALMMTGKLDEATAEVNEVSANTKIAALKTEAAFTRAIIPLRTGQGGTDEAIKQIDEFIKLAPKDSRGPSLLVSASMTMRDEAKQTQLLKRVASDFPETDAAKQALGSLRRLEAVGKPFDLEFTDAIKGTEISMKGLKGKVVVVDFWATWCGPCVAEMPTMKKLYAEYKDKRVEFIGVSLDQPKEMGGLNKLKEFVAKNEIEWPQYYQGNYWKSEFSSSWGINSIPCVFVVDAEGKVASVDAGGKLGTLIPELLKKAKPSAGAGGGN